MIDVLTAELTGKFVAIHYDTNLMLDTVYKVVEERKDTITVDVNGTQKQYWRSAVLAVFNNYDDAKPLFEAHKKYLDFLSETKKKDNEMRLALTHLAKHFWSI